MGLNSSRKVIYFITMGFILTLSILTNNSYLISTNDNNEQNNNVDFNIENNILKASKISESIHIDNNWSAAVAAGICTGSGTLINPYIIEDLVIDGGGSGNCILIENSTVFFIIQNCTLYNAGVSRWDAEIHLSYVNNSLLVNNNCSYGNQEGIVLYYSHHNKVVGNIVNINNFLGILLIDSNYNIIENNECNNNHHGISLANSDNNSIRENTINYNSDGIYLDHSNFNNIISNILIENSHHCIFQKDCEGNYLLDNRCIEKPAISGYNLLFLLGTLSVALIVLSIGLLERDRKRF